MGSKKFWKVIIFAVLTVCLFQTIVYGDAIKTGPRPGEKNPFNPIHPLLFRDDELLLLAGYTDDHKIKYHYFKAKNNDLTAWNDQTTEHQFDSSEFSSTSRFRHMAAASGRIINPDKRDTAVYAFFTPDGKVQLELWDSQSGRMANSITLLGTHSSDRSVDVAVGDLDGALDDKGLPHDEIVVVRSLGSDRYGNVAYGIDVLDYNLKILGSLWAWWLDRGYVMESAVMVAVGIGDFNGDGYPEIAVGMASYKKLVRQVSIYRFARDQDGNLVSPLRFEKVSDNNFPETPSYGCSWCANDTFDMTVGDFNGDGKDEIFMASSYPRPGTSSSSLDTCILQSDENLKLNIAFSTVQEPDVWVTQGGHLRAESGLFEFDPPNGWGLNRSQIALCYVDAYYGFIRCPIIKVDNSLTYNLPPTDQSPYFFISNCKPYSIDPERIDIDIATGNFIGHGQDGKATSPKMNLAISYTKGCRQERVKNRGVIIVRDLLSTQGENYSYKWEDDTLSYDWDRQADLRLPTAITAIDGDGDSYRLGGPIHFVIENLIGLDYVIQEPPKHVDCLPNDPGDPNKCDVVNISGLSDFNVEFRDSKGTTLTTNTTNTTHLSAGIGVEFGPPKKEDNVPAPKATLDVKASYDYDSSSKDWNSDYHSRTTSFTSKTEKDDFIAGSIQLLDIWRFPIIGYHTGDPNNPVGFQEITLPGPQFSFSGGGLDYSDWYQPIHQNRNLLSYPSVRTDPFPVDLGSFKIFERQGGQEVEKEVKETMNQMVNYSFSGTAQTLDISWTDESGGGSEKSYNHTLSASVELKTGFTIPLVGLGTEFTLNLHSSYSWGGSTTADSTNKESKGITLNVPSGDMTKAYTFKPAVYVSSGGGQLKVAHAVDPLGSTAGQEWWNRQYGSKPDPALNLPNRFIGGNPWTLNEDNNRMRMRGFFMRKNTPDRVSGEYNILGAPPHDGDTVKLCATVYNFSLHQPTGFFDVLFEYVSYNDNSGMEVGSRVSVGNANTSLGAYFDPTGQPLMKEVCVDWDTTGLSSTPYSYRFYVTVDPNDVVKNEIHEWKDAAGNKLTHGNNEGYWPWGIGIPVLKKQSQSGQASSKPSVSMLPESLAIETPSGLKSKGPVRVFAHQEYRLRSHIVANEDHPHHHYTVFFDGPPENGKVIALKTNFGLIDGDNYVWADWTPQETGEHEIYVHFIEDADDEERGDAWDSLEVIVREEPISWRDEVIDRLRGVEE